MRKLGVLDAIVKIIKSFYSSIKTRVKMDGEVLDEIEMNSGLHQG